MLEKLIFTTILPISKKEKGKNLKKKKNHINKIQFKKTHYN